MLISVAHTEKWDPQVLQKAKIFVNKLACNWDPQVLQKHELAEEVDVEVIGGGWVKVNEVGEHRDGDGSHQLTIQSFLLKTNTFSHMLDSISVIDSLTWQVPHGAT